MIFLSAGSGSLQQARKQNGQSNPKPNRTGRAQPPAPILFFLFFSTASAGSSSAAGGADTLRGSFSSFACQLP